MVSNERERGLPARIYIPIVAVIAALFLGVMIYLVNLGYGVTGSVLGKSASAANATPQAQSNANAVQGGPPPAVMEQLQSLRARIAAHPNDDVAITQLADMYLAASKFEEAVPLYRRALKVNPGNVAAQTGLEQANEALRQR
ncbi:MAG TPA: tetratricopeptide repeat protein [Candidatus Baltobacteraceae bacterium]|nr:tetratricopeptide repeat protein [Candidatus Baltobacteraceae bacterium]